MKRGDLLSEAVEKIVEPEGTKNRYQPWCIFDLNVIPSVGEDFGLESETVYDTRYAFPVRRRRRQMNRFKYYGYGLTQWDDRVYNQYRQFVPFDRVHDKKSPVSKFPFSRQKSLPGTSCRTREAQLSRCGTFSLQAVPFFEKILAIMTI